MRHSTRSLPRILRILSFGCLMGLLIVGTGGCSRLKPRKHWWQFWRSKSTDTSKVYHPDTVFIPPAPDVLAPDTDSGAQALPPDAELPAPVAEMEEPEPRRQPPAGMVSELQTVHFAYDSTELSASMRGVLDANAAWLLANPGYEVQVQGHCDERGTVEYNYNLGDRRAKAVKAYLVSQGVPAGRLHTISYGEDRPFNPNLSGDEAWTMNRRVEFFVY